MRAIARAVHAPELQAHVTAVHSLRSVRAGSALLRVGDRLLAVQDDAWSIAWIDLPSLKVSRQILKGHGRSLRKRHKPDFEAAVTVKNGNVVVLGSGSKPNRCNAVRIEPSTGRVCRMDLTPLYAGLRRALRLRGPLNIEAGVLKDDRLRLFHRGRALFH